MSMSAASTLLSGLRTHQATSPALIWYGDGGERIELSGKVLDNWVAKTSNFLVDELDAEPGLRVQLDLPVHWKTLVWVLAAWQTGCTVLLGSPEEARSRDVTVTASPDSGAAGTVVAVALGALDLAFPAELPAGVVDYAAEVRSYADTYMEAALPDAGQPALEVAGPTAARDLTGTVSYGSLGALLESTGAAAEVLLASGPDLPLVLAGAVRTWASGGAVVLTAAGVEPDERVLASERVTKRLEA
ncbi:MULTISPECIES: TIGR03089 family protein [unclassified Arthrobacter]|uniref:TIGR03089 family protein n=1 Tax=unclassified Arthrobacter TaxID=235627 RepID=UPI001E4FD9D0|nr:MULTISPECIES: TIGR03089 family protein [unclassified Arthrobacter]MCC9146110.1 TIGR03089 family protein [Arthrobacter sp. zg-Y919]MDK1277339.1 TIGR03089 family protein [Arthrobacter sp. zg.Y919]WIB03840.1 TIGR03089 family protein [Arthrobacter sp. zg-Y919]